MLRRSLILLFAACCLLAAPPRKKAAAKVPAAPAVSSGARAWMRSLPLREKVAQLIFIPFNGFAPNSRSREYRKFVRLIRDVRVGGLVLVNWNNGRVIQKAEPHALAAFLNRMQRTARIPLMVTADFERGASMRVEETTAFPHAMAFAATGDAAYSRIEGEITANEARAMGVHWVFYPVADVNNNPDNPIINIRSFGEDPEIVSAHVRAFIEGTRAEGTQAKSKPRVLTTVKHFPGHGDTAVDTHMNLATIGGDRARLDRIELAPFRAAIAAGVDSVMTAHIGVPALDDPGVPATLSPAVLTGLLRKDLGFKGLVVTDAMDMGGIAKGFGVGEAAVKALEAGADLILMPPDPDAALNAVLAAIKSGRLTQKRIEESLLRVLDAKQRAGLGRKRTVDLDAIQDEVNSPESQEKAQEIADRAVTLVRNEGGVLPLKAGSKPCFVVMAESRHSVGGLLFQADVRRRMKDALVMPLDPSIPWPMMEEVARRASSCDAIVAAAYASVAAYRGATGLAGDYGKLVEALQATGKPVVLVALGSPYLLRSFPNVAGYLATFSTVPVSETAAVKALFGEIAIGGRLPVSIPGQAQLGDGLKLAAVAR